MLGMDVVMVEESEDLSRPQRGESRIYSNNNLLKYSKEKKTSCCIKIKKEEGKTRRRKDSLYRDPSQVIELEGYE